MSEVVIERPRRGMRIRLRQRTNRKEYTDPDSLPCWEPIGRDGTKSLSDLLGPLRKYLRRQVGRPWDKVHSEITANLRPTSVTHQHILDHLKREVEVHAIERDGHVGAIGYRWWCPLREGDLYVCPRTKLLRVHKSCQRACCRRRKTRCRVNDRLDFRRIRGCWYAILFSAIPSEEKDPDAFDAVLGRYLYRSPRVSRADLNQEHNRNGLYAVSRRKLTRSERIAAGLPRNE